jgi:hypothetical protein
MQSTRRHGEDCPSRANKYPIPVPQPSPKTPKYAPRHLRILSVFDRSRGRRRFFQAIDNFNINDFQFLGRSVLFLGNFENCLSSIAKLTSASRVNIKRVNTFPVSIHLESKDKGGRPGEDSGRDRLLGFATCLRWGETRSTLLASRLWRAGRTGDPKRYYEDRAWDGGGQLEWSFTRRLRRRGSGCGNEI